LNQQGNGVLFHTADCWQGICLIIGGQILVALKRNDEYALNIKRVRPTGDIGHFELNGD
jgi:hypothetical protein